MTSNATFRQFPKTRPQLPEAYKKLYAREYKDNREGRNIASAMAQHLEAWMHRQVASLARPRQRILELGAGTLNHMPYEIDFAPVRYDVVEPFTDLYADSPLRSRVDQAYDSLDDVPQESVYDRIISVAVLEHMADLPSEIRSAKLRLGKGGVFQAGIPCEGGFLWGLAWRVSTGLAFKMRTGLNYGVIMRHEHLNNYDEIISVVRENFSDVRISLFPLPFKHCALYAYLECSVGPRA